MYWKVSVLLKCVFTSRIDFSLNLVPLYTTVSKNTVSVSYFGREFDSWDVSLLLLANDKKFHVNLKKHSCGSRLLLR